MLGNIAVNTNLISLLSVSVEMVLFLSSLIYIKKKTLKFSFATLAIVTALWQLNFSDNAFNYAFQYLEILRYSAFILLLLYMLIDARRAPIPAYWLGLVYLIISVCVINLLFNINNPLIPLSDLSIWVYAKIIFCLIAIVLSEQLLRHIDACRIAKFTALIVITQVSYDLFIHCNLLLYIVENNNLWQARSIINSATSLLLTLAIILIPFEVHQQNKLKLSNPVILFNSSVILGGISLILISSLSLIVQYSTLQWGELFSILFYVLALLSIATLSCMKKFRRKINVWISKHFFNHQYDYHQQWIKLDLLLSKQSTTKSANGTALQAIMTLFDCNAGALWLKGPQFFSLCTSHKITLDHSNSIEENNSGFIKKMQQEEWVFQSPKYTTSSEEDANSLLPKWFVEQQHSWAIIPLHYQQALMGFVFLCKEDITLPLTWEDLDILKLTGRQIASYLQQQHNAEKLIENKKFDLFNQVTAFAIHDIKNLVAQQSLMVKNADKFKKSPEFIDDMIFTLANSVKKMDKVLIKLRGNNSDKMESVDVQELLHMALKMNHQAKPTPTLTVLGKDAFVYAEYDKLLMVINHLLQNAFDATEETDTINIRLTIKTEKLWLEITDSGCGMDPAFINELLFKPFSSTKKQQGMGLGAYQIKALIHSLQGELFVESKKNYGTTFFIYLPLKSYINA